MVFFQFCQWFKGHCWQIKETIMTHKCNVVLSVLFSTMMLTITSLSYGQNEELNDEQLAQAHVNENIDKNLVRNSENTVLLYDARKDTNKIPKMDFGISPNSSANQLNQLGLMSENLKNSSTYLQGNATGIAMSQVGQTTQMTIYQNGLPVLTQSH